MLLVLVAVATIGALYGIFGIGRDAFAYTVALLAVVGIPVVVIFGATGIVLGVRRLWRGRKP